jgi:hypothetical protein
MSNVNPLPAGLQGPVIPAPGVTPQPINTPAPTMSPTPIGPGLPTPVPAPIVYSGHPQAVNLAKNIDYLNSQGFGHAAPDMQIALATGPVNHPSMNDVLGVVKSGLQNAIPTLSSIFHEPALQLKPTITQQLSSLAHGMSNAQSIAKLDLPSIQKDLQSQGFGVGLTPNGVWSTGPSDNAWSTAYMNWKIAQSRQSIGTVSGRSTFGKAVQAISYTSALPFLWRMLGGLASGVKKIVGDGVGAMVQLATNPLNPIAQPDSLASKWGNDINNIGAANPTTSAQQAARMNDPHSVIEDAGSLANLFFTKYAATAVVSGITKAFGEAAVAGEGNALKGAFTSLGKESAIPRTNAMKFLMNTVGLTTKAAVSPIVGTGAALRAIPIAATDAIPDLKVIYPWINNVVTGAKEGWQGARTASAFLYRFPIVRGATQVLPKIAALGGAGILNADIQSGLGATNSPLVIDLHNLTPLRGLWADAANASQFLVHSNYGAAGKVSQMVGKNVSAVIDKARSALNDQGLLMQWERGTNASFGKVSQMFADAGLPTQNLTNRIARQNQSGAVDYVAKMALDKDIAKASPDIPSTGDQLKILQGYKKQIWEDPQMLKEAQDSFSHVPNGYQAHVMNSVNNAASKSKLVASKGIVAHELAGEQLRSILGNDAHSLITPESMNAHSSTLTTDSYAPTLHNIGLAKKETMTVQPMQALINETMNSGKSEDQIHSDLLHLALKYMSADPRSLQFKNSTQLEEELNAYSHTLPSDVYPGKGVNQVSSPATLASLDKIDAQGFKVVYGTHIGHDYAPSTVSLADIGEKEQAMVRIVNKMGLGLTQTNDRIYAAMKASGQLKELQDAIDSGYIHNLPPGMDAAKLMMSIRQKNEKILTTTERMASAIGTSPLPGAGIIGRGNDLVLDYMKTHGVSRPEALTAIREAQAMNKSTADISKHQMINILARQPYLGKDVMSNDPKVADALGMDPHLPLTDEYNARRIYKVLQEGNRSVPARLQGIGKFTDLLDNQLGFAGRTIPFTGKMLPNLTATMKSRLMQFRYPLNLKYAFKRLLKTQAKAATIGIQMTSNPGEQMRVAGTYDRYMNLLKDAKPQEFLGHTSVDDALREVSQADFYNVFNPKEIQAHIYGNIYDEMMRVPTNVAGDALTPEAKANAIKQLESVYSYGDRTALERSTNAIFFPASFEKTVMRQFGAHLLDHQGQMLLAAVAMNFYDSNNGVTAKKWAEDNLPLIKQVESFYPYANGLTIGAFGGISRTMADPFLRAVVAMFAPKVIHGPDSVVQIETLTKSLVPMMNDANNIFGGIDTTGKTQNNPGGDFRTTFNTSLWAINNTFHSFFSHSKPGLLDPQTQESPKVSLNNGFLLQSQLIQLTAKMMKANRDGHDIHWPDSTPYVGAIGKPGEAGYIPSQKVNMDSINTIVSHVHTHWDKSAGAKAALDTRDVIAQMARDVAKTNPAMLKDYQTFEKNAQSFSKNLQADKLDLDTIAGLTNTLHRQAISLSLRDKDFTPFYNKYHEHKLGPLGGIN